MCLYSLISVFPISNPEDSLCLISKLRSQMAITEMFLFKDLIPALITKIGYLTQNMDEFSCSDSLYDM